MSTEELTSWGTPKDVTANGETSTEPNKTRRKRLNLLLIMGLVSALVFFSVARESVQLSLVMEDWQGDNANNATIAAAIEEEDEEESESVTATRRNNNNWNQPNGIENSNGTVALVVEEEEAQEETKKERIEHQDLQDSNKINSDSSLIPRWMEDYFTWHAQQSAHNLTADNWQQHRFLVARCLVEDNACGGTSDRLQSIPSLILMAHLTKRLLYIKWTRPAPLEEFLLPVELNWTVPDWLDAKLNYTTAPLMTGERQMHFAKSAQPLIAIRHQTHSHGAHFYNRHRISKENNNTQTHNEDEEEATFEEVYSQVWHKVFAPAPPVAKLIDETMQDLQLHSDTYIATHVRSRYTKRDQSADATLVQNAINCASSTESFLLNPNNITIFFASDSVGSTQLAVQYGQRQHARVVARNTTGQPDPLHLDKGSKFLDRFPGQAEQTRYNAADYYQTFVDFYLLANSQCVVFGKGGFGLWAALVSRNQKCHMRHFRNACRWKNGTVAVASSSNSSTAASEY